MSMVTTPSLGEQGRIMFVTFVVLHRMSVSHSDRETCHFTISMTQFWCFEPLVDTAKIIIAEFFRQKE
jgi:hypothetical protein